MYTISVQAAYILNTLNTSYLFTNVNGSGTV
jgi:hypothetical protein